MLRGQELHLRPQGYEPCELLLLHPAIVGLLYYKWPNGAISDNHLIPQRRKYDSCTRRDSKENQRHDEHFPLKEKDGPSYRIDKKYKGDGPDDE